MRGSLTHGKPAGRDALPLRVWRLPSLRFGVAVATGGAILALAAPLLLGMDQSAASLSLALALYLIAGTVAAYAMHRTYPHAQVGLCNLVTLARLVLVAMLALAVLEPITPTITLLLLAIVCLCLDGADGWLARKQGLSSAFGARFDVEVDAAFALLLALYALRTGLAGPSVLLLGLPHYLFALARKLVPWLNTTLPERFSRKVFCVVQIATLITLLIPQFEGPARDALVILAVLGLVWSFGRDSLWLYRNRL